ncbi:hypothetical protein H8959_021943 [Pygathrix nigripes]
MDNGDVAGKANRWFGVSPPKSGKMNMSILHQEELIAQKKGEIEVKIQQKAKQNQVVSPQPPHPGEITNAHNSSCVSSKLANDRRPREASLRSHCQEEAKEPVEA